MEICMYCGEKLVRLESGQWVHGDGKRERIRVKACLRDPDAGPSDPKGLSFVEVVDHVALPVKG